jgi:sn-glycerol 3-phosphate transport system ATP-binding protein
MNLLPGRITAPGAVTIADRQIRFDPSRFVLGDGQQVEVGIRPEDLRFTSASDDSLAFAKDFVEELGATRLFHGTVGDTPIVMAAATGTQAEADTHLAVEPASVHLFDPTTGRSLRQGLAT